MNPVKGFCLGVTLLTVMLFEPTKGIEPLTYGLRYRCSTVELGWHNTAI